MGNIPSKKSPDNNNFCIPVHNVYVKVVDIDGVLIIIIVMSTL